MSTTRRIGKKLAEAIDLTAPTYTPNRLLNAVIECVGVKNDYQLSILLTFSTAQISRIRNKKDPVSPLLMILIMDHTGWHITRLRELMGVPFGG